MNGCTVIMNELSFEAMPEKRMREGYETLQNYAVSPLEELGQATSYPYLSSLVLKELSFLLLRPFSLPIFYLPDGWRIRKYPVVSFRLPGRPGKGPQVLGLSIPSEWASTLSSNTHSNSSTGEQEMNWAQHILL